MGTKLVLVTWLQSAVLFAAGAQPSLPPSRGCFRAGFCKRAGPFRVVTPLAVLTPFLRGGDLHPRRLLPPQHVEPPASNPITLQAMVHGAAVHQL